MWYKSLCCFFALSLSFFYAEAQSQPEKNTYKGRIVCAESGKGLENVICQVMNADGRTIDFSFSDKDGFFVSNIRDDSHAILFKLLGYHDYKISIEKLRLIKNGRIVLSVSTQNLQEVVVSIPPITNHNDTIKYNVNSFRGQEDKYIVDILKKLPGIKVSENGAISYMGESINKFYIEGRDLLGGQYNLATNNLDVDAVSSVEVLENNQHVKALKGVEYSEKAAINLRLKKGYTVRPFGEAKLGAGASPFLYDGRGFAAYLSNTLQIMSNLKGGNNGSFILNELDEKLDIGNIFSYEPLTSDAVIAPSPRGVPLPMERHLFNKTILGSVNTLIPLNKESELKINFAYGEDKTNQEFNLLQSLATGNNTLNISEHSEFQKKTGNTRLSATYEHNSTNKYIQDQLVYYRKKIKTNTIVNGDDDFQVLNTGELYHIQNDFQSLFKFDNNQTFKANSFFRFSFNDEDLEKQHHVNVPKDNINETFYNKHLVAKNRISSTFDMLGNSLYLELNMKYQKKDMRNTLKIEDMNTIWGTFKPSQEINIERLQVGFSPSYQIKTKSDRSVIKLNLPFSYSRYSSDNSESQKKDERFIFSPSFSWTYKINYQWELYTRLGRDFDYVEDISLLDAPYLRGYRAIYIPSGSFNHSDNYNISERIRYKNLVDMLFFNLNILYRHSSFNFINKYHNTPQWAYHTTEQHRNEGSLFSVVSDISKTIIPWKLSLTFSPSYTHIKSRLIQQDMRIRNIANILSFSAKTEWKAIEKFTLIYNVLGRGTWNKNNIRETLLLKDFSQNLSLFFFPTKQIDLSITADHVLYEKKKNKYLSFFFLDLAASYKYKRMEFGITANNLLNNDIFSITSVSTVNSYFQQMPLRGREFMFSLKFNF